MKNQIHLEFSKDFTIVEIIKNDFDSYGVFTTFMEFVEKLCDLHSDDIISDFDVERCIDTYLRKSQIRTGFYGSMTPLFIIDKKFSFLQLTIPPLLHKPCLLKFDHRKSCMFGYLDGDIYYALSEYMLFSFEAYDFLNFLLKNNLITKEGYNNFLVSIESNILFDSYKEDICN